MAIGHFVHVLPADLHAALLRYNGHAALQVLIPYRRGKVQASHSPFDETEIDKAGILKSSKRLVIEISETTLNIANIPKQPVHDINEMGKLSE